MHIDGLRVDAVASMLYLDYGRNSGEWTPNRLGGNHNLEALDFLKHLNSILHQKHPKALIIAEESSVFPKVSFPLDQGGIGFDMKWNMGWMHDLLNYLKYDPLFRKHYHSQFLFSFSYAFTERFLLPFSHDEVVHGKKSLLGKMPGPPLFQFASLRLLYSCMICHPGKKLLFMGNEFASEKEWNCKSELEWHLLSSPLHQKMKTFVSALNRFYLNRKELWEFDFSPQGYQWIGCSDELHSILSYLRKSSKSVLLCAHNCTPVLREHYWVDLPHIPISIKEVFNSDAEEYGGLNHKNARIPLSKEKGVFLDLAPLATMIFEVKFEKTSHKNTARLH